MSIKINSLSIKQIESIQKYVEKWKNIALSTERLEREYAQVVINSVYKMLGYEQPRIFFFDSPYAASNFILNQTTKQLNDIFGKSRAVDHDLSSLHKKIRDEFHSKVNFREIYAQAKKLNLQNLFYLLENEEEYVRWEAFDEQIDNDLFAKLEQELNKRKIEIYFGKPRWRFIRTGFRISSIICQLDYYISNVEEWSTILENF